jgi:1-piperideine-2-carboxylate/1-pyrroline-2-carboxylate reductase [NAD(P)H]
VQPLASAEVPDSVDLVITLTTSKQAVYDEAPRADRLVIGVGAFTPDAVEIGARTVLGSALFVDDLAGAKHEAGDFIQAHVKWDTVTGIAAVLAASAPPVPAGTPVVFKTVGCAAWDLGAGRVARDQLSAG